MEFSTNQFENIAVVVAAIVALSLTLSGSLGPSIMLLTESLKSAFNVAPGKGGLVAVIVSVFVCVALALITAILSVQNVETREYVALVAIGAVVGLFVGSGAIASHKAAGAVEGDTQPSTFTAAYNLGQADTLKTQLAKTERRAETPLIVNGGAPMPFTLAHDMTTETDFEWNHTEFSDDESSDDPDGDVAPPDVEVVAGLVADVQRGPNDTDITCDVTPNAVDDDGAIVQRG